MADDIESRQRNTSLGEDHDCPPPIPPRPSFTFTQRRHTPVATTGNSTSSEQTDSQGDTMTELTSTERQISSDVSNIRPVVPAGESVDAGRPTVPQRQRVTQVATNEKCASSEQADRHTDATSQEVTSAERQISNDVNDIRPAVLPHEGGDAGRPAVPQRHRVAVVATTEKSTSSEQADRQTDATTQEVTSAERQQISNDVRPTVPSHDGIDAGRPTVPQRQRTAVVATTGKSASSEQTDRQTDAMAQEVTSAERQQISNDVRPTVPSREGVYAGRPAVPQRPHRERVPPVATTEKSASSEQADSQDDTTAQVTLIERQISNDINDIKPAVAGVEDTSPPVPSVSSVRPPVPPRGRVRNVTASPVADDSDTGSTVPGVDNGRPVLHSCDDLDAVRSTVPDVNDGRPAVTSRGDVGAVRSLEPGIRDGSPVVPSHSDLDDGTSPEPGISDGRPTVPSHDSVDDLPPTVPPRSGAVVSVKPVVPPRRFKSKKSTTGSSLSADVIGDSSPPSSAAVNDEVFLTETVPQGEEAECAQSGGDREIGFDVSEHQTETVPRGVEAECAESGGDGESGSSETGFDVSEHQTDTVPQGEEAECAESEVQSNHQGDRSENDNFDTGFDVFEDQTETGPQGEETECAQSGVQAERRGDRVSSEAGFDVTNTEETSSEYLTPDATIMSSDTIGHYDNYVSAGVVLPEARDSRLSDSAADSYETSECRIGTQTWQGNTSDIVIDDDTDTPVQLSRSSPTRAPVARFSEFDDDFGGLDPDLFRPDGLDMDVWLSDKTAKFTRSPSPFYEQMMDEDEAGLYSVVQGWKKSRFFFKSKKSDFFLI